MGDITLEQSLINIDIILSQYKGTREEHIALQVSFDKVKEELAKIK